MFSVTRLGYFKSSFYNFFTKVAQKYATFWAFEENIHIQVKTVVTTLLGATFGEKIGLLFISTPGHTAIMFSTPWTTLFCKLHLLPPYMALFLSMFPSFCVYLTANVYKLSPFSLSSLFLSLFLIRSGIVRKKLNLDLSHVFLFFSGTEKQKKIINTA